MVDLPVKASSVAPSKASTRLAILLLLGLLAFVGVVIITMPISKRGLNLPDIECSDIIVGRTPDMRTMMGVGGPRPIFGTKYEIVVKDIHISLPSELVGIFVKRSRCG